jgi:hypothetical protein
VGYDNNEKKYVPVYEKKIRAGKKRTYFFDIKETRNSGYSLVITESRKRFDDRGFDRTSIYVYQEDINKFSKGLNEAVDYIKTELMPDYDFDQYNNDYEENGEVSLPQNSLETETMPTVVSEIPKEDTTIQASPSDIEEVDKW